LPFATKDPPCWSFEESPEPDRAVNVTIVEGEVEDNPSPCHFVPKGNRAHRLGKLVAKVAEVLGVQVFNRNDRRGATPARD